jgi:twinkle protein
MFPSHDLAYAFTRLASGMKTPSKDYRVNILDWLDSKLWFYNLVGAAKIEMILDTFDYAYKRFGVDVFVIDSLMMCSMKTDDYNSQHEFVLSLIEFVTKRDVHIFLVAHASKGDKNKPNDSIGIDGVKGASEIVNLGHHVLTIKRANEDVEGVSAWFEQIKGRALDSWLGSKPLHFHADSTQFLAFPQDKPRKYVEFSILNNNGETVDEK